MPEQIFDKPSDVTAEDGVVRVTGPDGVEVKLTVEAAMVTSDRLLSGAAEAHGQVVQAGRFEATGD